MVCALKVMLSVSWGLLPMLLFTNSCFSYCCLGSVRTRSRPLVCHVFISAVKKKREPSDYNLFMRWVRVGGGGEWGCISGRDSRVM